MSTPTRPCPYCGQQVLATATACGYCGRPLPQQAAPQPPSPAARPAVPAGGPAKTMFGYAAPAIAPPGTKPAAPTPVPGAPAAPFGGQAPAPFAPAPAPAPAPFAPAPAAPAAPFAGGQPAAPFAGQAPAPFAPPLPAPPPTTAAAPFAPAPAAPFGGGQPAAPFAPAPQAAPAPFAGASQVGAPVPQMAGPLDDMANAAAAQLRSGKILGLPLSLLRDQKFEVKLLGLAAIVLFVTRFLPVVVGNGRTIFWWSGTGGTTFLYLVFPILVALAYAFVAFAPPAVKQNVPAPVLKWVPFGLSWLGTGLLYAGAPAGVLVAMSGGSVGAFGLVAWAFPVLVFGLVARLMNPDDKVAQAMIGLGGLLTFIGGIVQVGELFTFKYIPGLLIVHNMLWFVMILVALGSVAFALPTSVWPGRQKLDGFLPLVASVFLAWPLLQALLVAFAVPGGGAKVFLLLHMLALMLGFFAVLALTAPEALDVLRRLVGQSVAQQQAMAQQAAAAQPWGQQQPQPGPQQAPQALAQPVQQQQAAPPQQGGQLPPHVLAQLQQLDADWGRGGMSPEQYHARRNQILAGYV